MKQRSIYALSVVMVAMALTGCNSDEPGTDNPYVPIQLNQRQTRACEAGNGFALNLLKEANVKDGEANIALSPFTVAMNLSMLANGADGQTAGKILKVLDSESIEDVNSYYSLLMKSLVNMDRTVKLRFSNSVWLEEALTPVESFESAVSHNFDAQCLSFAPGSEQAWNAMNRWCSDHTDGIIDNFMEIPPMGNAYLLSATCFNGPWNIFDKDRNYTGTFHNRSGETVEVSMMTTHKSYNTTVMWGEDWKSVDLPYGNGAFAMTVILPDPGKDLGDVVKGLNLKDLTDVERKKYRSLVIEMPRFEIGSKGTLDDILSVMGFNIGDSGNDFSGICNASVRFSTLQETVISVNEQGTVAASVSGTGEPTSAFGPSEDFMVDRPFAFVISERSTGAIIFSGIVNKL